METCCVFTTLLVPHNNTLALIHPPISFRLPLQSTFFFFYFFGLVLLSPDRESFKIEKKGVARRENNVVFTFSKLCSSTVPRESGFGS